MSVVSSRPSYVSIAALLILAASWLRELGLLHPTVAQILEATGASRSRAYELKARLEIQLEELARPPGRPEKPESEPATAGLATELLQYVYAHPGCVSGGAARHRYSRGFRLFVLELLARHRDVALEAIAEATLLPLGTLKDWLGGGSAAVKLDQDSETRATVGPFPRGLQIETVLAEWARWKGGLTAFCDHLQLHCRIPFGRTLIGRILEANDVRRRRRRPRRSPDEQALRGAFESFFPHAQWVGDGSMVAVELNGALFVFNVELDVDAYSGAFVGAEVSPAEDSEAVIQTFREAIEATGTRPLALLLDNKPCNHTDTVTDALEDTMLIAATPFRPENKAHVEGGFGLLKATLEGLELRAHSPVVLAAAYLRSLVITWGRTINHRPRKDRGGRSRTELLEDTPSPEEIRRAREALQERLGRQKKARETLAARQNPVVRATLRDAFSRLGLDDPNGNILTAIARYPLDAVVEGIAIFQARWRAGTLPDGVDARYLLGIVKNLAEEREVWEIALALWEARVAAGDRIAQQLGRQRQHIEDDVDNPAARLATYVDLALQSRARLERFFWLAAAADVIRDQAPTDREPLFRLTARRISATHAVPHRDRLTAIRFLAAKTLPLT